MSQCHHSSQLLRISLSLSHFALAYKPAIHVFILYLLSQSLSLLLSFICPLLSFTLSFSHSLRLSPLPSSRVKDITEILSSQPLLIPQLSLVKSINPQLDQNGERWSEKKKSSDNKRFIFSSEEKSRRKCIKFWMLLE